MNLYRNIYFQFAIVGGLFIVLYYPFLRTLVHDWNIDDNYSHGYFIPLIAGYMIWTMRRELREVSISPSNWGLVLLAIGLVQLTIAKIGSELFLQRTSMILVLLGLSLFLLGAAFTKRIGIPIFYLLFMVPIPAIVWNQLAFPMKLFASGLAERAIHAIGIPILREGNILILANTTLEVADACSGLRSLTSLLALSGALAYLSSHSRLKKWILFLSACPIAVLVNIIRLVLTAGLASRFGEKVAQGFLHDFSGWLIFILGLVLLVATHGLLSQIPPRRLVR